MKHMRRTLAALLAMVILMTGIPFSFAEETEAVETVVQQIAEPAPEEEPAPTEESAPTEEPTDAPTEEPTDAPPVEVTEVPTTEVTEEPTEEATQEPTVAPTDAPEETASAEPLPSEEPTPEPGEALAEYPVFVPEKAPAEDAQRMDCDIDDVPFVPVYTAEALAKYMDMSVSELASTLGMDVDALLALSPEEIAACHERLSTPMGSNAYAGKISLGKAFTGYAGTSSTLDYEIYISRSGRYLLTMNASKYMACSVYNGSTLIGSVGHFVVPWTVDLEAGKTYTFKINVDSRYSSGYCNFSAVLNMYIVGSYVDRAKPLAYDLYTSFETKYSNDFQIFCFTAVEGRSYRISSTGSLRRTITVCDANFNSIKSGTRGAQGSTSFDVTLTPGKTYYLKILGEYYSGGNWWYENSGSGQIRVQCLDKTTKPISFTKNKSSVNPGFGDSVTFNVSTPYASKVRMLTDGKYIGAEHAVSSGKASFSESFHISGSRSVQVQGYYNGDWSLISDAQTITVNYQPSLGKPVFSSISSNKGIAYRNRDYTLKWNSLANAVKYSVYVYSGDELLYKAETDVNQITIPGQIFGTLGVYYVDVYGLAKLGQQSNPPARAEITVEDLAKGFVVDSYLLENGINALPSKYYDDFSIDHAPGLKLTLKSSSWIHLGMSDWEESLTEVGVTIDANPKSSDREGYIDISAPGCSTVRIKVLQYGACPHKFTGILYYDRSGNEIWDFSGAPCTSLDKYSHGWSVYVSRLEYVCWDCDAVLKTVTQNKTLTIKEEHSFDNGACWACGFREKNSCQHTSFVTKYDKYEFIDEQQHRHTSFDTSSNPDWNYVICAECGIGGVYEDGKVVLDLYGDYYIEELRSYKSVLENHSYVNGKCACGAVRAAGSLRIEGKSTLTKGVRGDLKVYDAYGKLLDNKKLRWSSSSTSIATVDSRGRVQAKAIGSATITAEAADGTYGSIVINVVPTPQSVTIYYNGRRLVDREVVTMDLNSLANLRAEVYPADADPTISWTTTNKSYVSVSTPTLSSTTITAHKETNDGVYITAQTSNGKKAKVKVRVVDPYKPTGVFLDREGTITLNMGSRLTLYATLQPATATRSLTWTSSSTKIATVDANGVVTPIKEGTVTITVKTHNGKYDTVKVKVVDPYKPTGVVLDREGTVTLNMGSRLTLYATLQPATATRSLTWTSSSTKIATVDANGVVTPIKEGTVTITVKTHNGKYDTVKVKVVDPYKPTGVVLDREGTVTLNMGSRLTLYATLQPATATRSLTWTSSSTKIATVDANGVVTPIKEGTVTITVKTHNGKYDTVKVKVVDPYKPTGVYLDREGTVVLRMGSSLTLKATLQPAGATRNLTWTSSSTKVATVDQNGVVTGIKEGTVTITVKTHNGKKDTVKVKVAAYYPVQALSLSLGGKSYGEMYVGDRAKLSVTYTPTKSCDFANLTWRSNNTKVVTVDGSGNLSAVGAGYAMITATDQNTSVSASFGVVVTRKARYRAIVIVENSFINYQGYKLPYQRASDRSGLISMLKQQNFNGQRVEQIADLSNLSKSTLVSKLRSLPSQWGIQEGDVTYFCFLGHGSKDGCLYLYSNGAENQYIRPSELKSLLDNIPGKVIVSIGSCYSGNYVYSNSADDDSSDSEGSPSDFTSAIIRAFSDGDSLPIAAIDESGAEIGISNEERMSWEESGIMPNSGELRQSKYYVLTSAARNEEAWSFYYLASSRYPYSINESKSYACFERAFCYAGGRDSVTKKTTWSSGTKTLSSVYSTVKKQVASYQKGTIYSQSVQVYPSNSSFVIFSK
ncbi:MAG: Ig-like domain-containing protein [Aristaeellaceae bacterium]